MCRCAVLGVIAIATLIVILYAGEVEAYRPKRRSENDRPSYEAKEDQLEQLPDIENPVVMRELACSSCRALTQELYLQMMEVHKKKDGRPRTSDLIDVVEGICPYLADEYGLLLKNNKPTTIFSKNKAITRMQGNWINNFILNRCSEIFSLHEDDILKQYAKVKDLEAFQSLVCIDWQKKCKKVELTRDEL